MFVLGFSKKDNWKNEMAKSVLEDFLFAIFEGKLVVQIEENEISKSTLAEVIENYKEETKIAYNYYQVLISPETEIREFQFEDLGWVKFYLLIQKFEKLRVGKSGEEEEAIGEEIEVDAGESGGRDYGEENLHKAKEGYR